MLAFFIYNPVSRSRICKLTDTAALAHKCGCVISSSIDVKNRMLSDKK